MKKLYKVYFMIQKLRKIKWGHQLIPISWNKLNSPNKLIRQTHHMYIICARVNGTGAPAQWKGCGVICMLLAWGPKFESHPHPFLELFIFMIFFLQNWKTSKNIKLLQNQLFQNWELSSVGAYFKLSGLFKLKLLNRSYHLSLWLCFGLFWLWNWVYTYNIHTRRKWDI